MFVAPCRLEAALALRMAGDVVELSAHKCTLRPQVVALFKELGKDVTQAEADAMIADVDVNSDGKVSFDEFCVVRVSRPQKPASGWGSAFQGPPPRQHPPRAARAPACRCSARPKALACVKLCPSATVSCRRSRAPWASTPTPRRRR